MTPEKCEHIGVIDRVDGSAGADKDTEARIASPPHPCAPGKSLPIVTAVEHLGKHSCVYYSHTQFFSWVALTAGDAQTTIAR